MTTVAQMQSGECEGGLYPFIPGINCIDCGRFIGCDGAIYVEHFEMSSEVASVDGYCGRCLRGGGLDGW